MQFPWTGSDTRPPGHATFSHGSSPQAPVDGSQRSLSSQSLLWQIPAAHPQPEPGAFAGSQGRGSAPNTGSPSPSRAWDSHWVGSIRPTLQTNSERGFGRLGTTGPRRLSRPSAHRTTTVAGPPSSWATTPMVYTPGSASTEREIVSVVRPRPPSPSPPWRAPHRCSGCAAKQSSAPFKKSPKGWRRYRPLISRVGVAVVGHSL